MTETAIEKNWFGWIDYKPEDIEKLTGTFSDTVGEKAGVSVTTLVLATETVKEPFLWGLLSMQQQVVVEKSPADVTSENMETGVEFVAVNSTGGTVGSGGLASSSTAQMTWDSTAQSASAPKRSHQPLPVRFSDASNQGCAANDAGEAPASSLGTGVDRTHSEISVLPSVFSLISHDNAAASPMNVDHAYSPAGENPFASVEPKSFGQRIQAALSSWTGEITGSANVIQSLFNSLALFGEEKGGSYRTGAMGTESVAPGYKSKGTTSEEYELAASPDGGKVLDMAAWLEHRSAQQQVLPTLERDAA